MEVVSCLVEDEVTENGPSDEHEITEEVEHLVAYTLVVEPHPFWVDEGMIVEDERVVERSSESETSLLEKGDLFEKAEGSRGSDVAEESSSIEGPLDRLETNRRVWEVNRVVDVKAVRWSCDEVRITFPNLDG